jgi:hypothetical protein
MPFGLAKVDKFIDYPIEGLNLNKYILSKELPNQSIADWNGKYRNPCLINNISSETLTPKKKEVLENILKEFNEKDIIYDLYAVVNHVGDM